MRTVGFLFVVIGGLLAYLGIQGKVGQVFSALKTGSAVVTTTTNTPGIPSAPTTPANTGTPTSTFTQIMSGNIHITNPNIPPMGTM